MGERNIADSFGNRNVTKTPATIHSEPLKMHIAENNSAQHVPEPVKMKDLNNQKPNGHKCTQTCTFRLEPPIGVRNGVDYSGNPHAIIQFAKIISKLLKMDRAENSSAQNAP